MKKRTGKFRIILFTGIFVFASVFLYIIFSEPNRTGNGLFIPPLLEDTNPDPAVFQAALTAQGGEVSFIEGKPAATLGYNGPYLGPTIRVRQFENLSIRLKNTLSEPTTIHWHGLSVDPRMDGVFEEYGVVVAPNGEKLYTFPVIQPAATLWYHPHTMEKTGKQVYLGLAGLFIIEDAVSERLPLPSRYGVNDIPLIFQDRKFSADGRLDYTLALADILGGIQGDTWLVNGSILPELTLPPVWVRFRVLNGSNARFISLGLDAQIPLYQIASEGGLLDRPLSLSRFALSPAERIEIMADFSKSAGRSLILTAGDSSGKTSKVLTIRILDRIPQDMDQKTRDELTRAGLPESLAKLPAYKREDAGVTRLFEMENPDEHVMHSRMMDASGVVPITINRRSFDPRRVDERARVGALELWRVVSAAPAAGMMMPPMLHNFHIHGAQFIVISVDGKPAPDSFKGLKDTVSLWPHREVELLVKFGDYPGKYVFHCHVLEHEDQGMMGVVELAP